MFFMSQVTRKDFTKIGQLMLVIGSKENNFVVNLFGSLLKIWMVMDFHSILCPLQIKCKLHGQQDVFFFGKLCSSSKSMRSEGLMRCELWVWTSEDSPMLSLHWIFPSKQVWCSWNYKSWSLMTTWNIPSYSTCATCYVTGHLTFLIVEKI
jgi:hypothetical protein